MEDQWKWGASPIKKGGDGFNDAGILTFNSHAINSFVREMVQNSNDAKLSGQNKIRIKITKCLIEKDKIPAFDQYLNILKKVEERHPQQGKFFKKAYETIDEEKIQFLVYSDSNTIGLTGDDDDETSSFYAFITDGNSVKENKTSGGSFGIGKSAIYGISNLRTVLFSSMNTEGGYIFQGVSKLASYKIDDIKYGNKLYLGKGDEMLAVRDELEIPEIFRRSEPGLSQFVMGVNLDDSWASDFSKAILRNYWMLLVNDNLEVEINDLDRIIIINSDNVAEQMGNLPVEDDSEYNFKQYGSPSLFYDTFLNGIRVDFEIPFIGNCSFYYRENEKGENNIAYLRNGMVVFTNIEKRLVGASITGVFICENSHGNEILRLMEPPKHDSFEPQMLEDKHESLSKKDGEKILYSIKSQIRNVIKGLIEKYKEETETPAFLTEFFEDLQKSISPSNKGTRINEKSEEETLSKIASGDILEISLNSENSNVFSQAINGTKEGEPGSDRGRQPGKRNPKGGKGKKGGQGKVNKTKSYPIRSRVFLFAEAQAERVYKVVLQSDILVQNAELKLTQYADSGQDVAFVLNGIKGEDGSPINFDTVKDSDGFISEYKITTDINKLKIIYLRISDNQRSAFILN